MEASASFPFSPPDPPTGSCPDPIQKGPFWSLQTPADMVGTLFSNREDFIFGMNLTAVCIAMFPGLRLLTFTLVSNQLLFLLSGEQETIGRYFLNYKKRLKRYLSDRFRYPDLSRLEPELIRIRDPQTLRQEILRINGYGASGQPGYTPYSYPWSAGILYFNPLILKLPKVPLSSLSQAERRRISHSRLLPLPRSYLVYQGIIAPSSYCAISEGESCFRDARQYFRLLSR